MSDSLTPPPIHAVLLDRFLAHTCSDAERTAVETWAANPVNAQILERLRSPGQWSRQDAPLAANWDDVRARLVLNGMSDRKPASSPRTVPRTVSRLVRRGSWLAAAVVALVVAGLVGTRVMPHTAESIEPETVYATHTGQRATVVLADGSRVTLAPQTTLTVPRSFGERNRVLTLQGEAYFDVRHTADHPFRVRTQSIVTQVLGTAFAVRHYVGDTNVRVAVTNGKVVVGAPNHASVVLVQGTVGWVTDTTAVGSPVNDVSPYTGWTSGQLNFREANVGEILTTLERWYGVQFRLTDPALAQTKATAFLKFGSTSELVFALEKLLSVSATSTADAGSVIITLGPHRHALQPSPSREAVRRALSSFSSEAGR